MRKALFIDGEPLAISLSFKTSYDPASPARWIDISLRSHMGLYVFPLCEDTLSGPSFSVCFPMISTAKGHYCRGTVF